MRYTCILRHCFKTIKHERFQGWWIFFKGTVDWEKKKNPKFVIHGDKMAKTGCVLSNPQFQHFRLNFLFVSRWVKLYVLERYTSMIQIYIYIYFDLTPTLKASMHWPSGLCSTSKLSEKCSSSCRWSSTDRVCWQLAFSAYGAGQEGLDMSPLLSPDRSSVQLTVLTIRFPCHHFNQHNQALHNQPPSRLIPLFVSPFSSPSFACFCFL